MIRYSVSQSDNIATDALLHLIGGVKSVESFIKNSGISDIAIEYNEAEQHENWENQYENWITPIDANALLKIFYENKGKLLTKRSHNFIWTAMKETKTGEKSIRGDLPAKTIIAHKTGQSGTNEMGVTAAVNDMGIVFLPNGKYFYLSVFVSDSKENIEENQRIISKIAKAAWDYFEAKYE